MNKETTIENICANINRRIYQMNYETEKQVREFLDCNLYQDKLTTYEGDQLANLLDVNENCIFDLLTDCKAIEEETEQ
jgi:hypothetical protein